MDFSPYKALLNRIIPLSYQQDTESLLTGLLPDADNQTRYQLLAELNRLKAPCLRVLDLNKLFPGQCRPVPHRGLNHMLPPRLEQRFMQLLGQYNGEYTRGLYETLLADLAAMRKQPAMLNATPWHQPTFGTRRKEPRLQFVTPVQLHLDDGDIQANSLDISINGLMATLTPPVALPAELSVSFPELAQQPGMSALVEPRRFRLADAPQGDKGRIRLRRIEQDGAWDQALEQFIEQNQSRYGHDAQDLLDTALAQCWGQTLLETGLGQSLFFDEQGRLQEVLCNRFGKKLLDFWRHERAGDLLASLLPPARVLDMAARQHEPVFLYSFRIQGKKESYYFAAEQRRLEKEQQLRQFISDGQRAGTLQLYHLGIRPVLFTDQITDNLDALGRDRLAPLKWQLWLTPLPVPELAAPEPANARQLLPYRVLPEARPISLVSLRQPSQRRETRFRFETPVELLLEETPVGGVTEDISVEGLKITLSKPVELALPALVQLNLPELNKLGRDWNLRKLPYRVVNLSGGGKVLHLHAHDQGKGHAASRFFTALLAQNQDKLRARPERSQQPAWMMWLTRQALQQLAGPAFLLGRNDGGFYVQGSLASPVRQRLMGLLTDDHGQAQLGRLISRQLLQSIATTLQRPNGKSHLVAEVWLAADASGTGTPGVLLNPAPAEQRRLLDGQRRVTVCLAVVNRLQLRQLDFYVPEWHRLTEASLYKTQVLEQNLAELALQCQVFNITDLAQQRCRLSAPATSPAPLPD
ncbi:PilZ domain-containing protein [Oceanimonas sp. CHS3-5]|uniref:PilZ domain-containing protein n=1 Tax=Oceanimonas sp. CHS3-5 TaxID=3068186 RepID=UPI00273D3299|nr:PilZ domain-containing protein [Oceanimonas sp. CHS3-5]MDP5293509.1 PilZ domain-containing protein [Oceanimonas sp. CHS3-5]